MANNSLFSGSLTIIQVLLIESNPADARLVVELLSESQTITFDLKHVDRLSTGLEILAQGGIDAVLLDLSLPDSQGLGTVDALRAQAPEVPILVLTGHVDERTGLKAIRRGVQEYLFKGQTDAALLSRSIAFAVARKQAEQTLQKEQEFLTFLSATLQNVEDGIVACDTSGRLTMFNYTSPDDISGPVEPVPADEWAQRFNLYLPDGKTRMTKEQIPLFRALQGEVVRNEEMVVLSSNGSERRFLANGQSIFRADGEKLGAVIVMHDITERKQAEEKLQKSEEMYRALAKNLPDGAVLMFDKELRFQLAEGVALEAQGFSKEGVEGKTVWEVLSPERCDVLVPYYKAALAGQERVLELPYANAVYLVHFVPLRDEQGETYAGMVVLMDITERKRTEEECRAKESAEAANRAKSDFLSRMSHELRTPLNAILGFAQLLEMDALNTEQCQSLDYIMKAGHHLLELINEVLDISRIEAGESSLSIESLPFEEVLQESLDLASSIAGMRSIQLHARIGEECKNTYIAADRQRMKQVFLNLISNGVKYNREGGSVTVTCERIEAGHNGTNAALDQGAGAEVLRISVSDTGYGISHEKLERLFTPFDRLGAEETEIEGTGLGLAVSKSLVEAMGGTINVHSTLSQGSVFSVELPIVESPIESLHRLESGPLVMPEALTQPHTVLYIEDNLSNLRLVERIFEHGPGVNLLAAKQGSVGLQLAQEHNPDLILLDLHLPDMQGDEVLRKLKEHPGTSVIPVVMITADATLRQIERLLAAGASAYLTKPLNIKQFLHVLEETLHNKEFSKC